MFDEKRVKNCRWIFPPPSLQPSRHGRADVGKAGAQAVRAEAGDPPRPTSGDRGAVGGGGDVRGARGRHREAAKARVGVELVDPPRHLSGRRRARSQEERGRPQEARGAQVDAEDPHVAGGGLTGGGEGHLALGRGQGEGGVGRGQRLIPAGFREACQAMLPDHGPPDQGAGGFVRATGAHRGPHPS